MEIYRLIGDYLHYWAREAPDRDALVLGDIRWTYKDFKNRVEACARALIANGVEKGDRVLLLSSPRPEFMVIYIAATEIGAVWGGLNLKSQLDEYQYRLSHSKPKILISQLNFDGRDYASDLKTLMKEYPGSIKLVTLNGTIKRFSVSFEEFLNEGENITEKDYHYARKVVKKEDPAMIVYTSGTTGKPKGAVLSHKSLIASYVNQNNYIKLSSPMRCIVPGGTISHLGVAGDCCTWTLINGGGIYFSEKFVPEEILEIVQHERITFLPGVPTMFQMELALPNFKEYDLSSLEGIWWSGAAASKDMVNKLNKLKIQLLTSYGMTETSGSATFTRPEATIDQLLLSIGRPAIEYEFKIADSQGNPAPAGSSGEIWVRGDCVFLGYYNDPVATRETIDSNGWLHTGDLAVSDNNGNIRLVGRAKEMFKSGGFNVYPREIEIVLEDHPGVALSAVIPAPDPLFQEVGCAFVIPIPNFKLNEDELKEYCRDKLSNYKVPKRFIIRNKFPLLSIYKIDKKALKQELLQK